MTDDSVFNTSVQDNDEDVDSHDNENVNYLEQYVGDGKKYASVDELAKAYAHSDQFINQLKNETTGLRTELNSRLALEELVTKLQTNSANVNADASNQNHYNGNDERPNESTGTLSKDQISEMVRKTINEENTRSQMENNRKIVQTEMKKVWGPNFVENLRQAQKTLGVDDATLDHLAKTSPQVFLNAILGSNRTPTDPNTSVPPRSQVNTMAGSMRPGSAADREWNDLNGLMKTDPQRYWSPSVQNKLMKLMEQRMKADSGS